MSNKKDLINILNTVVLSDDKSCFILEDEVVETLSKNNIVVKNKAISFVDKLNEAYSKSDDSFEKFIKKDIETELWDLL
jgi:hypothetical protein